MLNIGLFVLWMLVSEREWYDILTNPSMLFLAFIPLVLPALVKISTCWGNAVMWCII